VTRGTFGGLAAALAVASTWGSVAAADPLALPSPEVTAASPAYRYANLSNEQAFAELARRHVAYATVESGAPGVRAPIRLRGPLHGVLFHSSLPAAERETTPFEILDARLALSLDDFAAVLANHDVVEVVHFTMYRPHDGGSTEELEGGLVRHPGGMAIDVGALRKRNGALLVVATHWAPAIGAKTCGVGARRQASRRGRELQSIVCEASDLRLFQAMLTPHWNRAHHDHLHLELKPDTRWFLLR
jgi:hypothetical protein